MARLDPAARIRAEVEAVLEDGPLAFDVLLEELQGRGLDLGPQPNERLDNVLDTMERIGWVTDHDGDGTTDICFDPFVLIDGVTWTVPITAVDLASDTIASGSLGLLLEPLLQEWCELAGGGTVDFDRDNRRGHAADELLVDLGDHPRLGITFPPGWLAAHGASADGYLRLRLAGEVVHGEGVPTIETASSELVAALAATIAAEDPERACRSVQEVLTEVLVLRPDLRGAVLPPLPDWIEAAGLERVGDRVAQPGFDFVLDDMRAHVVEVALAEGFDEHEMTAFAALVAAQEAWSNGERPLPGDLRTGAALALGSAAVAMAFVEEQDDDVRELDELAAFAESLVDAADGRERAGPAWLVAQAHMKAGRTDQFEAWVDTALGSDDDHLLALHDKAWFEFDRGHARPARNLLTQMRLDALDDDIALLDEMLAPTRAPAGRNDLCPCGSGRKFKHCHLGRDEVPLAHRLVGLARKASWWLDRRHRMEVGYLAMLRAGASGRSAAEMVELDPLIVDAALSEGGLFAEWLTERGALLPPDEASLAAEWALVARSVFEVTDVRLDEGMTLRDLRTGDVVDVQERLGTHGMVRGRALLVRVLPTGDGGHQMFGGITIVPDSARDRCLELLDGAPTPERCLRSSPNSARGPRSSPARAMLVVFCETTWLVPDAVAAVAALDHAFGPSDEPTDEGREWAWLEEGEAARRSSGGHRSSRPRNPGPARRSSDREHHHRSARRRAPRHRASACFRAPVSWKTCGPTSKNDEPTSSTKPRSSAVTSRDEEESERRRDLRGSPRASARPR